MAANKKEETTEEKTEKSGAISVRCAVPNSTFRRAERVFSSDETVIGLDELTDQQLAQLRDEPMLVVIDGAD